MKIVSVLTLLAAGQLAFSQTSPTLTGRDIGAVAAAGSFTSSSGTFTLRASGRDVWNTADEFHFAYRTLQGDGEITTRVTSLTNTHAWTKAGVMLRESLNANSRFGMMLVTPGNGAAFHYRTSTGGSAAPSNSGDLTTKVPYWVRIRREGTTIRGYLSPDGVTWTQRTSITLSNLGSSVYVGLALTSHLDGTVATAAFQNTSITGSASPAPTPDTTAPSVPQNVTATAGSATSVSLAWNASTDTGGSGMSGYRVYRNGGSSPIANVSSPSYVDNTAAPNTSYSYSVAAVDTSGNASLQSASASVTTPPAAASLTGTDIGTVSAAGSFTLSGNSYTVRGSGADIWSTRDEFYFVYRTLDGNGEITARVSSLTNTHSWAKAGVMVRETLAANARFGMMLVTPGEGATLHYRTTVGGNAAPSGTNDGVTVAPYWVRVKREGAALTGYLSPDGVNWTLYRTTTLTGLASTVYVGLALTSHSDGTLATGVFQNLSVVSGSTSDTTAPSVPQNVAATASSASSVAVAWSASTDTGGSGVAGYRVFRNGTQVGGQITTTQFNDTGLAASTAYSYTVRAVDGAGNVSAASTAASVTTPAANDTTAPSVPSNLRTTSVTSNSVALAWNASTDTGGSGVAGYRVFRNGTQVGGQITATQFTDTGLSASTAYSYSVRAADNAGNVSAASSALPVTTASTGASGLDARPNNASCLAPNQPNLSTSISSVRVFPNLSFTRPIFMLQPPADSTRWYVVQQNGVVRTFSNVNNTTTVTNFIDIQDRVNDSASEGGLLGMAFDPAYASNGRVYLSYTANPGATGVLESRISRFTASGGVLNPSSEQILLRIAQPFDNHNGGHLAFGPDGLLYAGFGDGGSGGDPQNNSQNRSKLLGKMIRVDVRGTGGYTIPSDNPYAGAAMCTTGVASGSALCPEIYAYGFRNPWRWSLDRAASTAQIWLGDVGQNNWEEVNRVDRGGNYGWRFREGAHCFNPSTNCPRTANGAPLIDPVAEYSHSIGVSITGGYVYRGTAISSLAGRYVFGDFGSGRIFMLAPDSNGVLQRTEIISSGASISSFGEGNDGELYYIDYGGALFKIVPGAGSPGSTIPVLLSQTGCFDSSNTRQPGQALIPYAPTAPFWTDGANKQRWMALPNGSRITVQSDGDWTFPNGSVLVKNFERNGTLIETRLFMRHPDTGNWAGYTYRWNAGQTDATLVNGGLVATAGGGPWTFPSEAQCLQCHTNAAGRSLSLETRQLNSSFTYPQTGRTANQLTTLETIGMFSAALAVQPAYPSPTDTSRPLGERARSYLHTNCSSCHRPSGGTPVSMDLRYATAIGSTATCNQTPTSGDLGVSGARIILPGDANRSVLYLRMSRRDSTQMPPVGSHQVDTQGAALLQQWINSMGTTCQ